MIAIDMRSALMVAYVLFVHALQAGRQKSGLLLTSHVHMHVLRKEGLQRAGLLVYCHQHVFACV